MSSEDKSGGGSTDSELQLSGSPAEAKRSEAEVFARYEPGSILCARFLVNDVLGQGTFGRVFMCRDSKHNDVVALKVVRNVERITAAAVVETKILGKVYKLQRDWIESGRLERECCVKLYTKCYSSSNEYCMAFEPLGPSLLNVLEWNMFRGMPLAVVTEIGKQLIEALRFFKSISLVHTDLKLENVLFVSPGRQEISNAEQQLYRGGDSDERLLNDKSTTYWHPMSTRIKIIDFGGAVFLHKHDRKHSVINTRQYRAPEVLLQSSEGWSYPSDMWGAGCILAELWTGRLLFPCHENLEHLALMEHLLARPIPQAMAKQSRVRHEYFHSASPSSLLQLKQPGAAEKNKIAKIQPLVESAIESKALAGALRGMLELDPNRRSTPEEALRESLFQARAASPDADADSKVPCEARAQAYADAK